MDHANIVIIGGGLAGAAAAEQYRKSGGAGSVTLISHDRDRPVHRPPLSKGYLRGDEEREKVFVLPETFYAENDIELRLQTRVEGIDLAAKRVSLRDGGSIAFDKLVIATGARPRQLSVPGSDLRGIFYLRSLGSAEQLRDAYHGAERAVIIGAGFIGMEVAATLTQRGVACTVVEMAPRMWARIVPEQVAAFIQSYFEARGVTFRFGHGVASLQGGERVSAVVLDTGESLPADLVVAGVGVALNTELAEQSGLAVDRGITVDEFLRASHPDVYAVGDVASFPDPINRARLHLEHWDNALHQGKTLGKTLAGEPTPFEHVAYFFSDMFDLSLNMIGYSEGWDDVILRGDPVSGKFTTIYLRDNILRAALMINDDRYFDAWTSLVQAQLPVTNIADRLADPTSDPGSLAETGSAIPAGSDGRPATSSKEGG